MVLEELNRQEEGTSFFWDRDRVGNYQDAPLLLPIATFGGGKRTVYVTKHSRRFPACEHMHDSFDVIYVVRGVCRHRLFHQELLMQAGDLCLLSPYVPHSVYAEKGSIAVKILISGGAIERVFSITHHSSDVVSDFLRNSVYTKSYSSYLLFHTEDDEEILDMILDMYMEELNPDEYADRIITHMLMIFFIKLIRKYRRTAQSLSSPVQKDKSEDASRILRYIEENYATASLAEMADLLNYSVPHCSKYVKQCVGCSFSELQKRIRLQKATDYLSNTSLGIEQIGERIGYANPENFIRMFKKEQGVSPSQFRAGEQGA